MNLNKILVSKKDLLIKLIVLFLYFNHSLQAQFIISGVVKDVETSKNLSFATIKSSSGNVFLSDVDGKFNFTEDQKPQYFSVSYIGYELKKVVVNQSNSYFGINLSSINNFKNNFFSADEIISKVISSKNNNNPEKKLSSFNYKSFSKLIITANPDSLKGNIDSVFVTKNQQKYFSKLDSSEYKFKKIISKQHLFQTEKISENQFINKKFKETILGIKMAGFKQPVYEILGFNLQSNSIYDKQYELFKTQYKSPITNNSNKEYAYKLLDTITIQNRQTYLIYFKNIITSNKSGLEGLLFIDLKNYAVAKAIIRVQNVLDISAVHEYEFIENQGLWFPIKKTFKIVKGKNNEDIKILGGTIQFDSDISTNKKPREKHSSDYVYLLSETLNSDINYNTIFKIKKSAIAIEVNDDATKKPEIFWDFYRKNNLDDRSEKTYANLDSLVIKKRIETTFLFGKKVINGFVPFSIIDFDLRKSANYNNYEGLRFCIAGITNELLSKKFRLEGYTAYGTKDGNFKYNLGFAGRYGKFSNSWFGFSYTDDIQEIASTSFAVEKKQFKLSETDWFVNSSYFNYVKWRTYLETRIIPKTESIWELSHTIVEPKFNYLYKYNDRIYNIYNMTTAMVSLQWNPFSKYVQIPNGRFESLEGYPKFYFQVTKSLPKIIKNDFDFGKIDFKTEYEKSFLNGQKTTIIFGFGYAFGDIPITHLYNNSPNSFNRDKILQRITLEKDNNFETMYFNEFFSNSFALLQVKHYLKNFTFSKTIKPTLVFVTRMEIGNIDKPEQHLGIVYKSLKKGYFESGLELNKIYKGLGVAAFFRYGPNQLPILEDNLALRISYNLDLGF
jgi:Family of unknown function (DUF5686)